jgi:hypothetical protein
MAGRLVAARSEKPAQAPSFADERRVAKFDLSRTIGSEPPFGTFKSC